MEPPSQATAESSRTFLHIGYPKCASTYLQREVFPAMGNFADLTKQPHAVKWLASEEADAATLRERWGAAFEHPRPDKDHRIISYEGLAPKLFRPIQELYWQTRRGDIAGYRNPQRSVAQVLAGAYPGASVLIIIREPVAWAVSQYRMYWRRGHPVQGIDDYIRDYDHGYDKTIDEYQRLFGADRVKVVPFELLRHDAPAFLREVTGFIDPDFTPSVTDKKVNYAPDLLCDASYERSRRILKHRMKAAGGIEAAALKFQWLATGVFGRSWQRLKHGGGKHRVVVSEPVLEAIRPVLAASNRKVEELTGLDLKPFGYDTGR